MQPEIKTISKRKIRVLISEDTETDVILMVKELCRSGFEPEWQLAQTESEFMAKLDPSLDVILADYRLPQFNALEALRILRESNLDIPLIVVTGSLGDEVAAECIKQGATDYLLKDRMSRLGQAVTSALEDRRLREERLLQTTVLKATANAIMVTDKSGAIRWVNPAFTKLTGYTEEEVMGKTPRLLKSGKHNREFYKHLWETICSGQTWRGEIINRRKDGTLFHGEHTITPVRTTGGNITHFIGVMTDATGRKATEKALRESEERFRQLAENVNEVFSMSDKDMTQILYISPGYEKIWGRSCQSLCDHPMSFAEAVHPSDRDTLADMLVQQKRGEKVEKEYRIVRPDGVVRWIRDRSFPVRNEAGEFYRIAGVTEDITDRKRIELRMTIFANLGLKLSSVKTAREAAEVIVDKADQLFGWDACSLNLYSAEKNAMHHVLNRDMIGGQRVDCPPAHDSLKPTPLFQRTIEHGAQLILRDQPVPDVPAGIPFGNTSRRSESLMYVPIRDGLNVIGTLSIQSYQPQAYSQEDLTTLQSLANHCGGALNRIKTEEDHRQLEEQFRQSQKMEAVGQLAGGIAHDFNNLLTIIQCDAELLMMDVKYDRETLDQLTGILHASQRAAGLTRQLLTFSRKQVLQPKDLDLNEIVSGVSKMLQRIIGEDI